MTLDTTYTSIKSPSTELIRELERTLGSAACSSRLPIGLVGCGWIGGMQLDAYRGAGFNVVAICDRHLDRAEAYRDRYFPDAVALGSFEEILSFPDLSVLDLATHLGGRPEKVLRGIEAGLNVLSQKPFVEHVAVGAELAEAARKHGVTLAVNQNGRWAPHFGVMLRAVGAGLIGDVVSADFSVSWPHDQIVAEMPGFASMSDLILFDFGAHWFDLIGVLAPAGGLSVSAVAMSRRGQSIAAPVQASATVWGDGFISTVNFRAGERFAEAGEFRISGTRGVITHVGGSLGGDTVEIWTEFGPATVTISDDWFSHGLAGAMGALLDAVETKTTPSNSPESALRGLQITFAAVEAARTGQPIAVGSVDFRHRTDDGQDLDSAVS